MAAPGTTEITEKLIDIEKLFASKNPRLLKIIPGFVLSYLKRIIHQDEINDYIWRNREKSGLPFVEAILEEFGVNVAVMDRRSAVHAASGDGSSSDHRPIVPTTGRYIVAANHPLGGLDGMALMHALGKVRQDLIFPVNDLLMNVPGLRPLFIPINKHGRNTENARLIDATFASDRMILYFPAGLVSRKQHPSAAGIRHPAPAPEGAPGMNHPASENESHPVSATNQAQTRSRYIIRDLEWKNTFIKKALKYRRDIIPVFIEGRNSDWFYNLSNWRKRLGIKANIEMLYLVDEMTRQLGKTITLVVGDPIPWTTFDKSKTGAEWAEWVREKVYDLGKYHQ